MKKLITTAPLKYHGGKSYLADWIHSLSPPSVCDDPERGYTHRYIAHFGGGGEFWNWLPIDGISETINDRNGELVNFFAVLANSPDELVRRLSVTPFSEDVWRSSLDRDTDDPIERAVTFFVRYRQSRQGLGKDYSTPTRRVRRGMNENVSAWLSAVDGLPECHERLRSVEIRNMDAVKFIDKYDHPRALFYLDPPYLHETRSSTGEYEYEMSEQEHRALLERLEGIQGKFMLSGYRSDLYDEFASRNNWTRHEIEIDNKASSKKTKPTKVECIWTNYSEGSKSNAATLLF